VGAVAQQPWPHLPEARQIGRGFGLPPAGAGVEAANRIHLLSHRLRPDFAGFYCFYYIYVFIIICLLLFICIVCVAFNEFYIGRKCNPVV
jgi:hypothetical protein